MKTTEEQLLDTFRTVLKRDDIDATVSQQNCPQWDSLAHLNLAIELETRFGLSLEPEEIAGITSFRDAMDLIDGNGQARHTDRLVQ